MESDIGLLYTKFFFFTIKRKFMFAEYIQLTSGGGRLSVWRLFRGWGEIMLDWMNHFSYSVCGCCWVEYLNAYRPSATCGESRKKGKEGGGVDITLQFRDGEKMKNPNFSAVFLHNYSLLRVWGEGGDLRADERGGETLFFLASNNFLQKAQDGREIKIRGEFFFVSKNLVSSFLEWKSIYKKFIFLLKGRGDGGRGFLEKTRGGNFKNDF